MQRVIPHASLLLCLGTRQLRNIIIVTMICSTRLRTDLQYCYMKPRLVGVGKVARCCNLTALTVTASSTELLCAQAGVTVPEVMQTAVLYR